MMKHVFSLSLGLSILSVLTIVSAEPAEDWPQWRGPERNGLSKETDLLESWPEGGPDKVWSIQNLGSGFGTVSIQGDRIFVQGTKGGDSVLFCLNRENGEILWVRPLGRQLDHSRGGGPRGTPTIEGESVYSLTENGILASLKTVDGSVNWQLDILKEFSGENPNWLISESPLIDGDRLIVTPGGKNASVVALDKMTGKTVWTSLGLSDPAGYSSCIVTQVHGEKVIITLTAQSAVGLRASDGSLLWRYEPVANRTANVTTPVYHDQKVFYTSAYGTGAALLELSSDGDQISAKEAYFTRNMQNHHGGVILVDGYIYGFSGSVLTCIDFETGERKWRDRSVGKGSLTYADGYLYLLGEDNVVGLAKASPEGYFETGRFTIEEQGYPSWAHPVVSRGRLYLRNQGTLTCYDVKKQ